MKKIAAKIHRSLAAIPGKNVPSVRLLRREWSKRLENLPGRSIIAVAKHLFPLGLWERGLAYEIIVHHRGAQEAIRPSDVAVLGRGIDSWGEVDSFACYVAGPAWRQKKLPDGVVRGWARSPNRWWRRAALVSTVPLNNRARGGIGDALRTLKICRMLVRDRDEMVVKALSWTLRELSKRDRLAVRLFLERYQGVLPARVSREVRNKLERGLKNPRHSRSPKRSDLPHGLEHASEGRRNVVEFDLDE
jgi:hypothetical protein